MKWLSRKPTFWRSSRWLWVDKNVKANGTEKAAKAYLNWLYTPQAQTIITDYYYRVNNPKVMDALKDKFPQTELFRVEDKFGSA